MLSTFIVVEIFLIISLMTLPFISKRDIMFGVRIPRNEFNNKKFQKVSKIYVLFLLIIALLSITYLVFADVRVEYLNMTYIVDILLWFLLYIFCHTRVKFIKKSENWETISTSKVVDTNYRSRNIIINYKWNIVYILIFINTLWLGVRRDSVKFAYSLITIQFGILVLMTWIQYIIKNAKQEITDENTLESIRRSVKYRYNLSITVFLLGLMTSVFILLDVIGFNSESISYIKIFCVLSVVIYILGLGIKNRQGDSILTNNCSSDDVIVKNDDQFWKFGLIYFNKKDPSVFVSKRVGIGYSLNHARISTYLIYFVVIGFVITSIILGRK